MRLKVISLFMLMFMILLINITFAGIITTETIKKDGETGLHSDIVIDTKDIVHVVSHDRIDVNTEKRMIYCNNSGGSFNCENITNTGSIEDGVSIAIDSNNKIHVMYNNGSSKNDLIYCNNTAIDGSWSCDVVEDNIYQTYGMGIAIDSNDVIHMVYGNNTNITYRNNSNNNWDNIEILKGGGTNNLAPSIAIDSNNKIHVSYKDDINNDLIYCNNTGLSFSCLAIDSVGDVGSNSKIAIDSNDKIHISYIYYSAPLAYIKYCNNTASDGSWSCDSILNTFTPISPKLDMALDSNDKIHISYTFGANYLGLCNNTASDGSWNCTDFENVLDIYAGNPSIAIKKGRIVDSTDFSPYAHISYYNTSGLDLMYTKYQIYNNTPWLSPEIPNNATNEDSGVLENAYNLSTYFEDDNNISIQLIYAIHSQSDLSAINCTLNEDIYINCTTQANQSGYSDIMVNATDGVDWAISNTFRFTVDAVNDEPWLNAIGTQTIDEDVDVTLDLSINITDVETPDASIKWTYSTDRGDIITILMNNATDELSITTVSDAYGTTEINVTGWDEVGADVSEIFDFVVTSVNDMPSLSFVNMTPGVPTDTDDLVCVNGTLSDVEGDTVMSLFRWYNNSLLVDIPLNYSTLDAGNISDGESWYCGVIPYDFEDNGTEVFSPTRTIGSVNVAPIISTTLIIDGGTNITNLNPVNNLTDSYINITVEILDPDADTFKMFACVSNDATINGCGAGGLFCNSTASGSLNQSCLFNTTGNASGRHTVYIYTYDGTDLSSYENNYYYINTMPSISDENIDENGVFNGTSILFTFKLNDTNANEDVCWFNYTSGNAYEFAEVVLGTIVGQTCSFDYTPNATGDFDLYPYGNDTMNWTKLGNVRQGVKLNYTDTYTIDTNSFYRVGYDLNATRVWNISNFGTRSVSSVEGTIDNVFYWEDKTANGFSIASLDFNESVTKTLYMKRVPIAEHDIYSLARPIDRAYNYTITLNCSYEGINGTEIRYLIPKTTLTSYDSSTSQVAYVNSSALDISVDETNIGGTNYVRIIIGTNNTGDGSSVHEGLNPLSLYYSWTTTSSSGGPGGGEFDEDLKSLNTSCDEDVDCASGLCDYTDYSSTTSLVCVSADMLCGNNYCNSGRGETSTNCARDCSIFAQWTPSIQEGAPFILAVLGLVMLLFLFLRQFKLKNLSRDIEKSWKKAKNPNKRRY